MGKIVLEFVQLGRIVEQLKGEVRRFDEYMSVLAFTLPENTQLDGGVKIHAEGVEGIEE